jgi:hypothetical protein
MLGLAIATLVGSVMVLVPLWHPFIAALVAGVAAARAHMIGVQSALGELRETPPRSRRRPPAERAFARRLAVVSPSAVCTVVGTVLWLSAALGEGHLVPGVAGFLPHISYLWYVGVVLLIVASAYSLSPLNAASDSSSSNVGRSASVLRASAAAVVCPVNHGWATSRSSTSSSRVLPHSFSADTMEM